MDHGPIGHKPVLLDEVVTLLSPAAGEVVIDGTLGRGGHAAEMIPLIRGGTYLGLDVDADNARFAETRLQPLAAEYGVRLVVTVTNFSGVRAAMEQAGVDVADALLADLGFASNQMDDPARGFSFMNDGPLDMRLGREPPAISNASHTTPTEAEAVLTEGAAGLVNTLPEAALADLIYRYGEERLSRRIARKIVERRSESPIRTTGELAELCRRAYGPAGRGGKIHPATRTFQALRIAVNGDLEALDALLTVIPRVLKPGGRAGIISFHSLEDRPVKQAFLKMQQEGLGERLTRKPTTAGPPERARNPRSRSAKLRGIKRV
ncbi:MAG: 16S rRNA (cytosine(1402)-N(4))-methyltransferase RsmH [Planctomycetota bacterium]